MKKWYYKILSSPVGLIVLIGKTEGNSFKLNRVLGVNFNSEITLRNFIIEIEKLNFFIPEDLHNILKTSDSNKELNEIIKKYFSDIGIFSGDTNTYLKNLANKIERYFFNKTEISIDYKMLEVDSLTSFQKKVLTALIEVPFGKTVSYSQLAEKSGHPKAQRAVGTVMSKNPFPLLIPCHRVIRSDGKVGEFALGTEMKVKLLDHEKVNYK